MQKSMNLFLNIHSVLPYLALLTESSFFMNERRRFMKISSKWVYSDQVEYCHLYTCCPASIFNLVSYVKSNWKKTNLSVYLCIQVISNVDCSCTHLHKDVHLSLLTAYIFHFSRWSLNWNRNLCAVWKTFQLFTFLSINFFLHMEP